MACIIILAPLPALTRAGRAAPRNGAPETTMASYLDNPTINLFRFLWFTPGNKEVWGLPALYQAEPGTSKTSLSRFAAKVFDLRYHMLSPGLHGEGATGVVPVPVVVGNRHYLTFPAPIWVRDFRDENDQPIPSVLVIDELLSAFGVMRPPLLAAVDERMIGETFLGAPVRVTGFTNSAEECGTDPLTPQLANRFLHPIWRAPDVAEVAEHFRSGTELSEVKAELNPIEEQNRVMALWPSFRSQAAALVAAYLEKNPGDLHRRPKLGSPNASGAWPSRRSWEMAIRVLAGGRLHKLDETEVHNYLTATIGDDTSKTFIEYLKKMDLPSPEDVVDGKVSILPLDPTRLDKTYVILDACAAFVSSTKVAKRAERGAAMWKILGKIADVTPDLIIKPAQTMVKGGNLPMDVALPVLAKVKKLTDLHRQLAGEAK